MCPNFDKWVEQMLPDDCSDMLDEVIGYLMMNGNPLHKAILLSGIGRNGKGTLLRIIKALLGRHNCAAVPLQTMGENRFAVAELHMKLANIAGDLDNRHVLQTNIFKMVTGEDVVYAERKNGQPFRFTPWCVPIFSANSIPTSGDTSVGYVERWEVIRFPVNVNDLPGGPDPSIEKRIIAEELPGIAVRGVIGLRRLMGRGHFNRPWSVREAHREFVHKLDPVRAWLEERCDTSDRSAWTYRTYLHGDYTCWATANNYKPLGASRFFERLEQAGYRARKQNNQRGYARIRLLQPPCSGCEVDLSEL
jgi:P4 family phage/plasmid primase-like protien